MVTVLQTKRHLLNYVRQQMINSLTLSQRRVLKPSRRTNTFAAKGYGEFSVTAAICMQLPNYDSASKARRTRLSYHTDLLVVLRLHSLVLHIPVVLASLSLTHLQLLIFQHKRLKVNSHPDIYTVPLLTAKPEQQWFTMRIGVLTSISSRQHSAIAAVHYPNGWTLDQQSEARQTHLCLSQQ